MLAASFREDLGLYAESRVKFFLLGGPCSRGTIHILPLAF